MTNRSVFRGALLWLAVPCVALISIIAASPPTTESALPLAWDPGITHEGTLVQSNYTGTAGDYYFKISTANPSLGAWRTALKVLDGEANLYLSRGVLPNRLQAAFKSERTGSDGFVLSSGQFAPNEVWYLLVQASDKAKWTLVSGTPYVEDLGTIAADDSSGSGEVIIGPEGMRFFSTRVPSDMLAWRLWLNGATNSILLKKTSLPLTANNELAQTGQALVVPPYLAGGQQYFIGIIGNPGSTNRLDSRQQPVVDLAYGASSVQTVPGYPYTTYRVQVPPQQIAWQLSIPSTNGNPNLAVRRNTVPNENSNEAASDLAAGLTDSIALVPPVLSDGTFYVTVWATNKHQFTLENGPAAVTDIAYLGSVANNDPDRTGWRYFRVTDIGQQLGSLGWELAVSNAAPGTRIAIRRNAAPSIWTYRNPNATVASYHDVISLGERLQHPGHQADVWYVGVYSPSNSLGNFTLTTREIDPGPWLSPTETSRHERTNVAPGVWEYFRLDLPATGAPALGWDLRLEGVTGSPVVVVRRDALPESMTTGFSAPVNATNWPSRTQWVAAGDWTQRSFPAIGTASENGRILVMARGRPLEPGRYYVGVQSSPSVPQPVSFTLVSRWIGTDEIPVRALGFASGAFTNTLAPRQADYFAVTVPPGKTSFKLRVRAISGETMLVAGKDTLPNVSALGSSFVPNTSGKSVQKTGDEQLVILPPKGTNVIAPGTYYLAVIGEGQNPQDLSRVGMGSSTYVIETFGELPETQLGLLGSTDLIANGTLAGGEVAAYHFNNSPGTLGFWIALEDRLGNPVAVSRYGPELADPGLSSGSFSGEFYGNDGGEQGGIAGTFLTVGDPGPTETIMIKARQSGPAGVFPDAGYRLRVTKVEPQPLAFDGGVLEIANQDPQRGGYYFVDVPPEAAGWDLRIENVTSGTPQLAVAREVLPIALSTSSGFVPNGRTNWPAGFRWAAGRDWTDRPMSAAGLFEDGRVLAMGMGKPLEPGRYYISVLPSGTSVPMSYSLVSRGIGTGMSIPVKPLPFNGGTLAESGLEPREAAYYRVEIPEGAESWKVRLGVNRGEALLVAAKDALPNVAAAFNGSLTNSAGRKMQKPGDEYFLLLPPPGTNVLAAGSYYLAVVGEGESPQPSRVGFGTSDYTISSIGSAPVRDLGQLGASDLIETAALPAGDTQVYRFSVPQGTLGLEARLENRTGNPVMVLRQGARMGRPGAFQGSVPAEFYGHDDGETLGVDVNPSFISVSNPTNTVYTLIVMARSAASGGAHTNAVYTLRLNASGTSMLAFDNEALPINEQPARTWKYFRVTVPPNAAGWDVRLFNVTNGQPRLVIRREGVPSALQTTPWSSPGAATAWPTNSQWAPGMDWTRRPQSALEASVSEEGRVFACGMGRPLEPGTYYVGVFNNHNTAPSTYTILSRGIGDGFTIPVTEIPFDGGFHTGTLPAREAAYFKVIVPTNTPGWKVKLKGESGEAMMVGLRGAIPNIDMYQATATLANGKGMQKPGNEHFVLLPATGQTNLPAGTNYFAVVSEGINPAGPQRIGSESSTYTFESQGTVSEHPLGLLTSEDIVRRDTVEGGESKLYRFQVPPGMMGFKVRLENRVGNPTFVLKQGDKAPDPGAPMPSLDAYGNEGGYASNEGHSTLFTVPNPVPGVYTLMVKGRTLSSTYPDASYTLRIQEVLIPQVNFSADLNGNGILNSIAGILDDNERIYFKFFIPSTNAGQPVIGWKLDLAQSSGLASMRVRRDNLPADATSGSQMQFTTAAAIIVPPFLTNGTWYVEVKGAGSTVFTLTSSPLLLDRPAWEMPGPGEPSQTPGLTAPFFADTGIDTNGVERAGDTSTFLEQGSVHYYAVSVPENNDGVLRAALEAVSGNPDLYLRYGAPPTLYHSPTGTSGTLFDRSMLANATEYANWVPLDGKLESRLKPGFWYIAVRAASNANARYRLKLSAGSITDIPVHGPLLSNQVVAGGDWRYYRLRAPATVPGGFNLTFSQQSGDVIVHLRDTIPPGNGASGSNGDLRDWVDDARNHGPYKDYDAPGTYAFDAPPIRPGAVYYFGVRAASDAVFSIGATTNGAPNSELGTVAFYGGSLTTNLAPGTLALVRIDVPREATRWKHSALHAAGVGFYLEQGTIPVRGTTDDWRGGSAANSSLNQYLLSGYPWVPGQSYFLAITNATAQAQEVVLTMDGRNAATDDNDSDGLPDAWELQFFGNTGSQIATSDPDRDGATNFEEFMEGTDPTQSGSFRARLATGSVNGDIVRSPESPSYSLRQHVTLTATPAPGYAFIAWTGDADGRMNPLVVTMDRHKDIGAIFKLAGDDFVTAFPLFGTAASATATNVSMSKEPDETFHAGNPGGKSIWWRWTAPDSGLVSLTTAGSAFSTVLAVYSGESVATLQRVASDYNSGGVTNRSAVQFNAAAGAVYHIAVDGYHAASGRIRLALSMPGGSVPPPSPLTFRALVRRGNGEVEVVVSGSSNRIYRVEASADLRAWLPVGAVATDAGGLGSFVDPDAESLSARFYRGRD